MPVRIDERCCLPSQRELVLELLRAGHLTSEAVTSGLRVTDTSQRHRNWHVRAGNGISLIVKQALEPDEQVTLGHEVAVYTWLSVTCDIVAAALPRLLGYNSVRHLLLVEYVEGRSLAELLLDNESSPTTPAATLGHVLAQLHTNRPADIASVELSSAAPWALDIHRPTLAWFRTSSEAGLRLRAAIQQRPALTAMLDTLRDTWSPRALIHGDLKLQHVIDRQQANGPLPIAIIDWEMAQAGDPAWDIGTVIAGYLGGWLRSIPLVASQPLPALADRSQVSLDHMQRAVGAFWHGYMTTTSHQHQELLANAGRYAAVCLMKDLTERLQDTNIPDGRITLLLDVCEQLLTAPEATLYSLAAIDADGIVA